MPVSFQPYYELIGTTVGLGVALGTAKRFGLIENNTKKRARKKPVKRAKRKKQKKKTTKKQKRVGLTIKGIKPVFT